MATFEELEEAFIAVTRKAPSAAQALIMQDLAARSQNGVITDDAAHAYAVDQAEATTSVAAMTYQFFTGEVPSTKGLDYLVNSTDNTGDLNDPFYQGFNTENRYINFAVNLGVAGEGRTDFVATFGALAFGEAVAVAYNRVIGTSQATEAGVDVAAAIANIAGRKAYFDDFIRGAGVPAADQDLAAKAAMVGYILAEAVKAGVGVYAQGLAGLYADLGEDGLIHHSFDLNDYVVAKSPPGNSFAMAVGESYGVGAVGAAAEFSNNADAAWGVIGPDNAGDEIVIKTGNGWDVLGKQGFPTIIQGLAGASISIDLGGGNDYLEGFILEAGDISIDGGAGDDSLDLEIRSDVEDTEVSGFEFVHLYDDAQGRTVDFGNFSGVERLSITGSANDDFTVENLTSDLRVSVAGGGGAVLVYDDVDEAEVILEGGLGVITVQGVEDVLTISTGGSATWDGITTTASELVVETRRSLNLGEVVLGGNDPRKLNLAAATKDLALRYITEEDTEHTVLLGSGDDLLRLLLESQDAVTVTLGDGDDTVFIVGEGNIGGFSSGALKSVTRITDFEEGDSLIMNNFDDSVEGDPVTLDSGLFTGVEETDEAYLGVVAGTLNDAGFSAWNYAVFEAADGSGVFVYSAGATNDEDDDFYVKLVGVSTDDLDLDNNTITHG